MKKQKQKNKRCKNKKIKGEYGEYTKDEYFKTLKKLFDEINLEKEFFGK